MQLASEVAAGHQELLLNAAVHHELLLYAAVHRELLVIAAAVTGTVAVGPAGEQTCVHLAGLGFIIINSAVVRYNQPMKAVGAECVSCHVPNRSTHCEEDWLTPAVVLSP